MRVVPIVRNLLEPCLNFLHARRFAVLVLVIEAVFRSSRLTLTALGRALRSPAHAKNRIKRLDRFLGNSRLHAERVPIYRVLAARLLGKAPRPVLVLDWTQLVGDYWALWVGVAFLGRTVPLYAEAHRVHKRTKRRALERFLRALREVLPAGCRPILLVDAEFCTPFFEACNRQGFDFIVRLRGKASLRPASGRSTMARGLAKRATARPQCCGKKMVYDSARQGQTLRVVLAKKPSRRYRLKAGGAAPYRKRALTPWVLATTIEFLTAAQIVNLYAKRMQVEEMFRDAKDPRYGWALNQTGSRDPARLSTLLVVATIAMTTALLVGSAADNTPSARRLQANTERRRRVLSLFSVGILLIAEKHPIRFRVSEVFQTMREANSEWLPTPQNSQPFSCNQCRRGGGWH